jgi:O-antigen ligase
MGVPNDVATTRGTGNGNGTGTGTPTRTEYASEPDQPWRLLLRPALRPSRPLPLTWRDRGFWLRPVWLVVLLLVALCYPNKATTDTVALARPTPGDAAAVLLVAVLGLRLFTDEMVTRLRSPFLLPLPAIAVAAGISTVLAHDPVLALAGYVRVLEIFVVIPAATFLAVRDRLDLFVVFFGVIGVALFQGVLGLYQFVSGSGAGFGSADVRAVGTFGIGDQLAMAVFVGCGLLLCLSAALTLSGRWCVLATCATVFLCLPLAVSLSRGSVLSVAVAAAVATVAAGWRRAVAVAIAALVVGVLAFGILGVGGSVVGERLATIGSSGSAPDRSVQDRYDLWQAAQTMWKQNPVTGVGVKNFADFRDSQAPLDLSSGSDAVSGGRYVRVQLLSPHNEYLLILSEQGVLGIAALLSLLFVVIVGPLRRLLRGSDPVDRCLSLGLLALGVRTAVDSVYGDIAGSSALLLAVLFGISLRYARYRRPAAPARQSRAISGVGRRSPALLPATSAGSDPRRAVDA